MSVNQGRLAGGFWGLVEQKGPWKSTANDAARSQRSQPSKKTGGGISIGGTKNAGHAGWYASINPQVDPNVLPSPPRPSQYVQKSIIVPSTMMPKTVKGSILRNAPTETLRPEPSGVQKAGHNYVPHFQPSGEEAPRVNETPSLMGESSISSDDSSYFSASSDYRNDPLYQHLQQTLNDTTFSRSDPDVLSEPNSVEAEQYEEMYQDWRAQYLPLRRPEQEELGTQISPETMETTTSPLVNTRETATSPLVETVATLPYLEAPIEVPYLEPPPGVAPLKMYPGISEQELLNDRKPKRKIKKKPGPKIDPVEFEKFSKNNRNRIELERDETNRKTPKPKIPTAEFENYTYAVRNRNRKGFQGENSKRKGYLMEDKGKLLEITENSKRKGDLKKNKGKLPEITEDSKKKSDSKPNVKKEKLTLREIQDRIERLKEGVSLEQTILELEKRLKAYELMEKKAPNGLPPNRAASLKSVRAKLLELKKQRK